jgi:hypothetical protein
MQTEKMDVKSRNAVTFGQHESNYEHGHYTRKSLQNEREGNGSLLAEFNIFTNSHLTEKSTPFCRCFLKITLGMEAQCTLWPHWKCEKQICDLWAYAEKHLPQSLRLLPQNHFKRFCNSSPD